MPYLDNKVQVQLNGTWKVPLNNYNRAISKTEWKENGTTCSLGNNLACGTCKWCQNGSCNYEYRFWYYQYSTPSYYTYGTILKTYSGGSSECWMDRNLGAIGYAGSPTDSSAYGHLFQWGRFENDKHQYRNSSVYNGCVNDYTPYYYGFITSTSAKSYDWYCPHLSTLWKPPDFINNPCPAGWHVPSLAEWQKEQATWSPPYKDSAFSRLKLTLGGRRESDDGSFTAVNSRGWYWTYDTYGLQSYAIWFSEYYNYSSTVARGRGLSVRCIKD